VEAHIVDYLRQLGDFVWAVINNWAGYTTGGLVVAALWLWSTVRQKPTPQLLAIVVACFFLFVATFNAWREQNAARVVAEGNTKDALKKFDTLTIPNLNGEFSFMNTQSISGEAATEIIVQGLGLAV
jgi:hypothetical protein